MPKALTNTPAQQNFTLEQPASVRLTENQRKVIEDKYLKSSKNVETWLSAVAHNIALTELLYHPSSHLWGLFDGVRLLKKETLAPPAKKPEGPTLLRSFLFHMGLPTASEREANFH